MKKKHFLLVFLLPVTIFLTIECSKSSSNYGNGGGGGGGNNSNKINISGYAFVNNSITVPSGTTITWTNNDGVAHTVTADGGSFDSGNIASGATWSHTFSATGTFTYHCSYHTYMKGTVVIN
jgi:plastocyanin